MVTQTQTHRLGLNPFLTFYIDAMLNFDGDVDANANVKCEQTFTVETKKPGGFIKDIKCEQTLNVYITVTWYGIRCKILLLQIYLCVKYDNINVLN